MSNDISVKLKNSIDISVKLEYAYDISPIYGYY
jgi:hypothetical protein